MSITRSLLNWVDEKMDEVDMDNDKLAIPKCFGLGIIEGLVDGAVLSYPILIGTCIIAAKAIDKLKD